MGTDVETQRDGQKPDQLFVCEGVVTTRDPHGETNVSPMGPLIRMIDDAPDWSQLVLRPFSSSRTYANLGSHPHGVFHVTDDVLLLARGAIGQVDADTTPCPSGLADRLVDCCRWYEFRVDGRKNELPRETFTATVVDAGEVRPFIGFHRARHAVLEAAILATRVHLLPADEIERQLDAWEPLIEKTATQRERAAWQLLRDHFDAARTPPVAAAP